MFQFRSDKGRKLLRGLEIAREDEADYVMFVDADDFVHRDVCAFVHDVRHPHGWMIYHGYRMDEGRDWIAYRRSRFHKECGSSHILKTELAPFPTEVNYTLDFGDYFIRRYEVHAHLAEAMAAANQPLARLPFFGAVYYLNRESIYAHSFRHPDSVMRKFARCALKGRFVTTSFRRNFGIS